MAGGEGPGGGDFLFSGGDPEVEAAGAEGGSEFCEGVRGRLSASEGGRGGADPALEGVLENFLVKARNLSRRSVVSKKSSSLSLWPAFDLLVRM